MPAPTIREIPLPARAAFSNVSLLGSNSEDPGRVGVQGLLEREGDPPSLEVDLDFVCTFLRASLSDRPRDVPIDEMLDKGVCGLVGSSNDRSVLSYEVFIDGRDDSVGEMISATSSGFDSPVSSIPTPRSVLKLDPEVNTVVVEPEDEPSAAASFGSFLWKV